MGQSGATCQPDFSKGPPFRKGHSIGGWLRVFFLLPGHKLQVPYTGKVLYNRPLSNLIFGHPWLAVWSFKPHRVQPVVDIFCLGRNGSFLLPGLELLKRRPPLLLACETYLTAAFLGGGAGFLNF